MKSSSSVFANKLGRNLAKFFVTKIFCFSQCFRGLILSFIRFLVLQIDPLWKQLSYFLIISLVGYLVLRISNPRISSFNSRNIDVYFTSVSALTGSSMSTVEMEVFSNFQLIVMTILMFIGGEVFISMLGLHARSKFYSKNQLFENKINPNNATLSSSSSSTNCRIIDQIELGSVSVSNTTHQDPNINNIENDAFNSSDDDYNFKYNSVRYLVYVILAYLLVIHVAGSGLVALYVSLVPSANQILKQKGLQILTFSVFTTVSTFSNSGFVPTNENMMVFKNNSLLLLILFPQGLFGNTLYPFSLRLLIWVLKKITNRAEFDYILKNSKGIVYRHLLSSTYSSFLAATAVGFIFVQLVLFCAMEWNSGSMEGLNPSEKLVASLFQVVNSRHTGESVFDLSIVSPAILVLFVVMMYLPPYTAFLPTKNRGRDSTNWKQIKENKNKSFVKNLIFSQLSYLVIFIILVCITEIEKLKTDPLNFNVFNITLEVISAYGNVGFSTGYSCKRQLKPDDSCKDAWYGFVGRWSNQGKFILILVMLFGRIKKFNMKGGKAWKLS